MPIPFTAKILDCDKKDPINEPNTYTLLIRYEATFSSRDGYINHAIEVNIDIVASTAGEFRNAIRDFGRNWKNTVNTDMKNEARIIGGIFIGDTLDWAN
jgi:hypothetical protein